MTRQTVVGWVRLAVALGGVLGMGLVFFAHGHAQVVGALLWSVALLQFQEAK